MNVLSLFDGIACGRLALERAGIPLDGYYASEIDNNAMRIATHNYEDIVELGGVAELSYDKATGTLYSDKGVLQVGHIDLMIGGSPCTDFSSIGMRRGMSTEEEQVTSLDQYMRLKQEGVTFNGQSYLFWEYVRLLNEVQPDYFLLENVVMAERWRNIISEAVGCKPIAINSALVSAQNRPRLYWTNIPNVKAPDDKGITLDSILDENADTEDVFRTKTVQRAMPRLMKNYGYIPPRFNAYNASKINDKACALSRGSMITSSCATLLFVPVADGVHTVEDGILDGRYKVPLQNGRYNVRHLNLTEMERLQTLPDGYTAGAGVAKQARSRAIGNGWTADVIAHILSYLPRR